MGKRKIFHTELEHKSKCLQLALRNISGQEAPPLPLDTIKVGQVIFINQTISEGPNDYSPGGIFAKRGDAVIVKRINAYSHPYRPSQVSDMEKGYCEINWAYSVKHCDVTDDVGFQVYRKEVTPIDPLVTVVEQREYIKTRGRYKTLESRFEPGVKYEFGSSHHT